VGGEGCGKTASALKLARWISGAAAAAPRQSNGTKVALPGEQLGVRVGLVSGDECEQAEERLARGARRLGAQLISRKGLHAADAGSATQMQCSNALIAAARHEAARRGLHVVIVDGLDRVQQHGSAAAEQDKAAGASAAAACRNDVPQECKAVQGGESVGCGCGLCVQDCDLVLGVLRLGKNTAGGEEYAEAARRVVSSLQGLSQGASPQENEASAHQGISDSGAEEWIQVHVPLPPESVRALSGNSSHLLRNAMRRSGTVMSLEHVAASGELASPCATLTIEGTHMAIASSHKHMCEWSGIVQAAVDQQLAVAERPQELQHVRAEQLKRDSQGHSFEETSALHTRTPSARHCGIIVYCEAHVPGARPERVAAAAAVNAAAAVHAAAGPAVHLPILCVSYC